MPITSDDRYLMELWSEPMKQEDVNSFKKQVKEDFEANHLPVYVKAIEKLRVASINFRNAKEHQLASDAILVLKSIEELNSKVKEMRTTDESE